MIETFMPSKKSLLIHQQCVIGAESDVNGSHVLATTSAQEIFFDATSPVCELDVVASVQGTK